MEDAAILALYWSRAESAITETAKKYGHYCAAIARNIAQNNEDAEECVNDTYLKTWNAIPPQRPVVFCSYLGKITRNLALNRYKERRTKKRGGGETALLFSELEDCVPSGGGVETESESNFVIGVINAWLLSLDRQSRVVFVRRYWYADAVAAIAARFQMSESKVKSLLYRTRKTLKACLENEGVRL